MNHQISKMVSRKSELALRYAFIDHEQHLSGYENDIDELIVAFTRYLNGHRIKVQVNLGYRRVEGITSINGLR